MANAADVFVCPSASTRADSGRFELLDASAGDGHVRLCRRPSRRQRRITVYAGERVHDEASQHGRSLVLDEGANQAEIEDGTSTTISIGEVIDAHTRDSSNIWTYTLRYGDCYRSDGRGRQHAAGRRVAAVGENDGRSSMARSPAGIRAGRTSYISTGTWRFVEESIDFDLYQNLSTIAGQPDVHGPDRQGVLHQQSGSDTWRPAEPSRAQPYARNLRLRGRVAVMSQ